MGQIELLDRPHHAAAAAAAVADEADPVAHVVGRLGQPGGLALGQDVQRLGLVDRLGQPVIDQHAAAAAEGQAGALWAAAIMVQMGRLVAAGAEGDGRRPRVADDGAGLLIVEYLHRRLLGQG